jgi:uncharacterized protein YndB with AHSA1/START domain
MSGGKGRIVAESAVVFERILTAPADKAWAFLTETARLPQWFGEGRIEPREGGAVTLMSGHIRGVVTIWRPYRALGYTWNVFEPGQTVSAWPVSYLEFALDQAHDGVALTLTHRPIPEAMQKQTAMGWHTMLDLVAAALTGAFPARAVLFAKNAALYGIDLNTLKS